MKPNSKLPQKQYSLRRLLVIKVFSPNYRQNYHKKTNPVFSIIVLIHAAVPISGAAVFIAIAPDI